MFQAELMWMVRQVEADLVRREARKWALAREAAGLDGPGPSWGLLLPALKSALALRHPLLWYRTAGLSLARGTEPSAARGKAC